MVKYAVMWNLNAQAKLNDYHTIMVFGVKSQTGI